MRCNPRWMALSLLLPGCDVLWGGLSKSNPKYCSDSIPCDAPLRCDLSVNQCIVATAPAGPPPVIAGVMPAFGSTAGGTSLAISGMNFLPGTTVSIAGLPAATLVTSATALSAVVPMHLGALGHVPIVITNPDGQSASQSGLFSYFASDLQFSDNPFPVGMQPYGIAIADFNGDTRKDIAVSNSTGNSVSVLLRDSLGGFATPSTFAVGNSPYFLTAGDFNGDGKSDLAVVNSADNNLSVMLSDGTGGFGMPSNFAVGVEPLSVVAADWNGDQILDLAVANSQSATVSILFGDGTGGFPRSTTIAAGQGPYAMVVADFNGDHLTDLGVTDRDSDQVTVLLGDGLGGFGVASTPSVGSLPISIAAGDFDGDGNTDLVTADLASSQLSVMLGLGAGYFQPAVPVPICTIAQSVYSVAVADLNGDGHDDLAAACRMGIAVEVALGNGTGGFGQPQPITAKPAAATLAAVELTGDGRPELVVTSDYGNSLDILVNASE